MNPQPGTISAAAQCEKWVRRIAQISTAVSGGVGLFVWLSWGLGRWQLSMVGPEYVPVAPATALLLLLLSSAVFWRNRWPARPAANVFGFLAVVVAVVLSSLALVQYALGLGSPWEFWLAPTVDTVSGILVGRMSVLTAATFLLAAVAFLFQLPPFDCRRLCQRVGAGLALVVALVGLLVILGYASGTPLLYGSQTIPMAFLTAFSFIWLGLGLLLAGGAMTWCVNALRDENLDEGHILTPSLSHPMGEGAQRAGEGSKPAPHFPWAILVLFLALTAVIGAAGFFYLRQQQATARQTTADALAAIADMKVTQILSWRQDRLADAKAALDSRIMADHLQILLLHPADLAAKNVLLNSMAAWEKHMGYRRVLLLDRSQQVRFAVPAAQDWVGPTAKSFLPLALRTNQVLLSDLHLSRMETGRVFMDMFVPLLPTPEGPAIPPQPVGVLMFEIDPSIFLFPLLQSWPIPRRTAETLLLRRDGNDALVLNELRLRTNTALTLRLPLNRPKLPAARAAQGEEGVAEGVDYRNQPVLAAMHSIPDSPWFMVTKIDQTEVYAPLRRRALAIGLVFGLLWLVALLGLGLFWRQRKIQCMLRDITDRRRAEAEARAHLEETEQARAALARLLEEQREAEEKIRQQAALLDQTNDAIVVRAMDGAITYWNRGAETMFGWTAREMLGRNAKETMVPAAARKEVEQSERQVLEAGYWVGEMNYLTKSGQKLIGQARASLVRDAAGTPHSFLVLITDLTEQKKLEVQFLRAQRLEAVGTLAGGIAHDLNNILAPILMAAPLLRRAKTSAERANDLDLIESSAQRAAEVIRQLLTFSRGQSGQRCSLHLKPLLRELHSIIRETFPKNIALTWTEEPGLWPLVADPTQLHQVLLNLCINARDAMPEGGTLRITAANFQADDHFAGMAAGVRPGAYVRLQVSDTGIGIRPEDLDKIFDPFFTTKEAGRGTGLGLATVHRVVTGHNGFVQVRSQVGQGTTFDVFLPASPDAAPPAEPARPAPVLTGQGQLILVVDDEERIRSITQRTLLHHGYRVVTACDGTEAIEVFARHQGEVKAVLTDLMMPGLDGLGLMKVLTHMAPGLPVVLSTGAGDDPAQTEKVTALGQLGVGIMLTKPYTAEDLLQALRAVLPAR